MRTEQEMFALILETARQDERIRAVILNGSRANPHARRDIFQDFDVIFIVTDIAPFKRNRVWIERFGELMILQMPDDMGDPPPEERISFAYLMQFMDGNRIDLTVCTLAEYARKGGDSLSVLLLDKDGALGTFPPASETDYLPRPPTEKTFLDCCNEFWWVSPYVAKGLWRKEIPNARYMLDEAVRGQLMKMLTWYIGMNTQYQVNPGKMGKYFEQYLEPDLWSRLEKTYADASYEKTWEALFVMGDLFRKTALPVAEKFGFEYPLEDDQKVSAYLKHIQSLPGPC
jgi:aminoglycoside 6-adenylyltransferase